nr:hypothetical protein [uncultured bacterium]
MINFTVNKRRQMPESNCIYYLSLKRINCIDAFSLFPSLVLTRSGSKGTISADIAISAPKVYNVNLKINIKYYSF